jgi:hypothetical protein
MSRNVEVPERVLLIALRALTEIDHTDEEFETVRDAAIRAFDRMSMEAQDEAKQIACGEAGNLRMLHGSRADYYCAHEWESLYEALAWPAKEVAS